jgi:hypothetical protein
MKLSEAIRLGAMLKPQGFGELCVELPDGRLATCAMGAAQEAAVCAFTGTSDPLESVAVIYARYEALLDTGVGCPACEDIDDEFLDQVIHHLNDEHCWTREQIADWVETIERAHPVEDVPVSVERGQMTDTTHDHEALV